MKAQEKKPVKRVHLDNFHIAGFGLRISVKTTQAFRR